MINLCENNFLNSSEYKNLRTYLDQNIKGLETTKDDTDDKMITISRSNFDSIQVELARSAEVQERANEEDWKPELTTGICAAFAFECVRHVITHRMKETIPPLITSTPSYSLKYKELLLIKGIFQALGNRQNFDDVRFNEAGFALKAFLSQFNEQNGENVLLMLHNPNAHLTEAHIVYINFKEGIIGDGGTGFIWKAKDKSDFLNALMYYLRKQYSNQYAHISALLLKADGAPSNQLLLIKKISLYSSILYNIYRTRGIKKSAVSACHFIAGHEAIKPLVTKAKVVVDKGSSTVTKVYSSYCNYLKYVEKTCADATVVAQYYKTKMLLKWGINKKNIIGAANLEAAIKTGYEPLIQLLLEAGAPVTDAQLKSVKNSRSLFLLLLSHAEKPDIQYLRDAITNNDVEVIKIIIKKPGITASEKNRALLFMMHADSVGVDFKSSFKKKYDHIIKLYAEVSLKPELEPLYQDLFLVADSEIFGENDAEFEREPLFADPGSDDWA